MRKRIPIVEKIMFYNILLLLALSIIILFASNVDDTLLMIKMAIKYSYIALFQGHIIQTIAFILVFSLFLVFIGYWITNILINKRIIFGPFYLISFIILFIYIFGYYGYIDRIDTYIVMMIFLLISLLASSVISFVLYLKELKSDLKEIEKD